MPSRTADRIALAVVAAATLALLAVSLIGHRTPLYGVETDLLGDSVPATRALLQGRIEAGQYQFRGPGYPSLLAGATLLAGGDEFLGARLLNVAAAGTAALAAFMLVRLVFGSPVGLAVVVALFVNPVFLQTAIESGSDMPALALALMASWLVMRGGGARPFAVAGLLTGAAFLTRYNTVFLIPAAAVALFGDRRRGILRRGLAYAAGVAVTVVPWMLFLGAATGHPMQNQNYVNVAYEVYGEGRGWAHFWTQTGAVFHSFADVVRYDPARFARHVGRNLATRWLEDARLLMPWWLGALAAPGLVLVLWRRRGWPAVAAHFLLCYLVLTLVFYTPRFFLYLLPFYLAGTFGLLLWPRLERAAGPAATRRTATARWMATAGPIVAAVLIAGSAAAGVLAVRRMLAASPEETRIGGRLLRRIGRPGQRVMARKPHVAYFAGMEYLPLPDRDSFSDFLDAVEQTRADYLFISGIEISIQPQLGVLADSGVAVPGLMPLAHTVLDSTRAFSLYQVVPIAVSGPAFDDSLLRAIRRFAARRPGQAWPQAYLGGQLVTLGRYRESLAPLAQAEGLDPKDTRVARFQAIACAELGLYDAAAAACQRAVGLDPSGDWEMAYLGHIRLLQGRAAEARGLLLKGVMAAPTNLEYLAEYVRACIASGAREEAAAAADQLLRSTPDDATARLLDARAWLVAGHPERALALARMGSAATGPDAPAWAALADSLRRGFFGGGR